MKECSKSIVRRLSNPNFSRLYFKGKGIDIGGKPDPLSLYTELFPLVESIDIWDKEQGDAQYLKSIEDETYDFVHSSHCLEHLYNPYIALLHWIRILKPNGYLIFTVPDEDAYEQGEFPSSFNEDHKWTFTIYKNNSWSRNSMNILCLLSAHSNFISIEKIELLNSTYRTLPRIDQTLSPIAECGIEIILKKNGTKPDIPIISDDLKKHFNQYKYDHDLIVKDSKINKPFTNIKEL